MLLSLCVTAIACSDDNRSGGPGDTTIGSPQDTAIGDTTGPATAPTDATSDDDGADVPGFAYLVVEPETIDFGALTVGQERTLDVELENAGDRSLTLSSVSFLSGIEVFATNVRQALVTPGDRKIVKVTFYALAPGAYADVLRFESNAVNGARLDVTVIGTVTEAVCQDADLDNHGVGCPAGGDCNDSDSSIYVGAPERCNRIDDDCDGLHDEDFIALGSTCQLGFGECNVDGVKICAPDGQSLQCSVNPVTGGDELCNELDDDCDGATDEDFASKNKLCSVGLGACRVVDKFVCSADKTSLVCNVVPKEPGPEICDDGIDNDCDGITDEGELEICGDNVDNDCDGETDESGSSWGEVFFARNWYSETVAIYPSKGDGTFDDPVQLEFPPPSAEATSPNRHGVHAVGDFDGDRWLDLAVLEMDIQTGSICTVQQDCPASERCWAGRCQLKCSTDAQCPSHERCIDWSAPSADPLYTFCTPPRKVFLARSSCDGDGDIAMTEIFTVEPGESLGPVIDADGNGHLDFVGVSHWSAKTGFVWLNDGNGGFTKLTSAFSFAAWSTHGSFNGWDWVFGLTKSVKDINGDGFVDLLGRTLSSGGNPPTVLWVFRGNGDGTFDNPVTLNKSFPMPSNLITADDFDGDGDQDIVGGLDDDGQPGGAWMLLNLATAQGTDWVTAYPIFDVAPTYNSGGERPGTGTGTSFDFDGDNQPDVLAGWVPEECGSYVWGCTQIRDPAHICYGGNCRKIALIRNRTHDACLAGTSCIDGQCVPGCTSDCTGKQCGSDGCGGTCGVCGGGQLCTGTGQCVVDCTPQCDGKSCGDNGCGGTCGQCGGGESCVEGQCVTGCVPNCNGRQCGDDGCGGSCVVFGDPEVIDFDDNTAINVTAPQNVPPTKPGVTIDPAGPTVDDDLVCLISAPSYDLDPVTYQIRWYRDGVFAKDVGERQTVPAALTAVGETWTCRVRGTDGTEWSVPSEATASIGEAEDGTE